MSKIGNLGNVDYDVFEDFAVFSLNNTNIGQYTAKGIKGSRNVIIGKNAGKIAYDVNNSVFIGTEAGSTVLNGNRNLLIGEDKSGLLELNSTFNLGFNEIHKDGSLTIGLGLVNSNNDILINNYENNSSNIKINDFLIGETINLGLNNYPLNNSNIYIGNSNQGSGIIIGSYNINSFDNGIIIGNNIDNYKFSLNIDNVICKYNSNSNNLIYLGIGFFGDIPIIIGSKDEEIFNIDNNNLFIKGGLSTNILKIGDEGTIELKFRNGSGNIVYYLPPLPENYENIYLTTDRYGNLEWVQINEVLILIIITKGDTICNDMNSINMYGGGNFMKNVNISDKTTDELKEGLRNFYLRTGFISNYFLNLISTISTNIIRDIDVNSNFYYTPQRYSSNFTRNFGKLTTDDFKYYGSNRFYSSNTYYSVPKLLFKNLTTDFFRESNNFFVSDEGIREKTTNIFNIIKEGTVNYYYTNERLLRTFNNYLNSLNTNSVKEGLSNNFYKETVAIIGINQAFNNTITTDFFREGSNLYAGDERLIRYFNSRRITTNDIRVVNDLNFYDSNGNYEINCDLVKEGTRKYMNNSIALNNIIFNTNSDIFPDKIGNSNIYATEKLLISDFSRFTSNEYTTDNINEEGKANKFIKNNFYNNELIINGFLKASNVNDVNLEALREIVDEVRIGPNTQVVNTYDVNTFNVSTPLSNIQINYNNDNEDTIPFIVINNRVGVHNINPKYELDVNGVVNCCNLLFSSNNFSNILSNLISYDQNRNVGIGTDTPVEKLQVIGNILASGTILSSFSDIRLKEVIEPINNPLNIIKELNGFKYRTNELGRSFGLDDKIEIGLNAQEVKKVIPEVVSLAPFDIIRDGNEIKSKTGEDYLSVKYERIIPYLIEGIKELKRDVEDLKNNQLKILEMIYK
jgi:hypothetical protein